MIQRIASSIKHGHGVYVLPPERVGSIEVQNELAIAGFDQQEIGCLKFLEMAEMGGNLSTSNIIPLEGDSIHDDFRWSAISHSLFGIGTPYTSIISFDTLKSIYGPDSYLGIIRHISMLVKNGGTFFGLGWSSNNETKKFSNYAHTHIRIDTIDRFPLIFGERPYSNLNYLSRSEDNIDIMRLTPIL